MTRSENQERLQEILTMPASRGGALIRNAIRTHRFSDRKFTTIFRPFWVTAIEDQEEIELRSSLDDALKVHQYLDLAIACGYVELDGPAEQAIRSDMGGLVSKSYVESFMSDHDYDDVFRLAQRVGLRTGNEDVAIVPCPMRYASFLDIAMAHDEDPNVNAFLDRLDDYVFSFEDHQDYWDYLERTDLRLGADPGNAREQAFLSRTYGMITFVRDYADFFYPLDPVEQKLFAAPVRYWLAKLFGYERDEAGHWTHDEEIDWSTSIRTAPWARALDRPDGQDGYARAGLGECLDTLQNVLTRTISELTSTIPAKPGLFTR